MPNAAIAEPSRRRVDGSGTGFGWVGAVKVTM
jgi:hypothetical protein